MIQQNWPSLPGFVRDSHLIRDSPWANVLLVLFFLIYQKTNPSNLRVERVSGLTNSPKLCLTIHSIFRCLES